MKTLSLYKFLFCALFFFAFTTGHLFAAGADNKNRLKITILENTSFNGCAYSGVVAIEVNYKTKNFTDELGQLILESSQDGVTFSPAVSQEIERGRGSTVLSFDAGDCIRDIRVSIQ